MVRSLQWSPTIRANASIAPTTSLSNLMIEGATDKKELDFCGVFRISPDGKDVTLLVDDFARPNGLCFSSDESLLYINDTERMNVRVFDVKKDGTITNGRLFVNVEGDPEKGRPDGLKVDPEGNMYCTGPGGILVYSPAGKYLGKIEVPKRVTNFAWGESDWKTLFITCFGGLYRLRMNVRGIPLP
jgi:gluconolactonase